MLKVISFIGEPQLSKTGKEKRDVKFTGDDNVYGAYGYSFQNIARFKVGDEVDIETSPDGKFINKVSRPQGGAKQATATGAQQVAPSSPPPRFKEDKEKDIAVYTRYAVDFMIAKANCTPQVAVDTIMAVRGLTMQGLNAKRDDGKEAKMLAAEKMAEQVGIDTSTPIWDTFKGRYQNVNVLVSDLESVLSKKSILAFTTEGEMTIVSAGK